MNNKHSINSQNSFLVRSLLFESRLKFQGFSPNKTLNTVLSATLVKFTSPVRSPITGIPITHHTLNLFYIFDPPAFLDIKLSQRNGIP